MPTVTSTQRQRNPVVTFTRRLFLHDDNAWRWTAVPVGLLVYAGLVALCATTGV